MSLIKKKKSFVKCVSGENDSEFFFVEGGRGRGGGGEEGEGEGRGKQEWRRAENALYFPPHHFNFFAVPSLHKN